MKNARIFLISLLFVLFVLQLAGKEKEVHLKVVGKTSFKFVVRKVDFFPRNVDYRLEKRFMILEFNIIPVVEKEKFPNFGIVSLKMYRIRKRYEHVEFVSLKRKIGLQTEFDFSKIYEKLNRVKLEKEIEFATFRHILTLNYHLEDRRSNFLSMEYFRDTKIFVFSTFSIYPSVIKAENRKVFEDGTDVHYTLRRKLKHGNRIGFMVSNDDFGGNIKMDRFFSKVNLGFWNLERLGLSIPMYESGYNCYISEESMYSSILNPNLDFEAFGKKKIGSLSLSFPMSIMDFTVDVGISVHMGEDGFIPFPIFSTSFPVGEGYMVILSELSEKYEAIVGIKYNQLSLTLSGGYSFIDKSYSFNLKGGYTGNSFSFLMEFGKELGQIFGEFELSMGPFFMGDQFIEVESGFRMMENLEESEVKFKILTGFPLGRSDFRTGGFIEIAGGGIRYGGIFEIEF